MSAVAPHAALGLAKGGPTHEEALRQCTAPTSPPAPRSRWMPSQPMLAVIGVVYVAASLFGSSRFLLASNDVLANDLFWAGFNASTGGVFVATAFNDVVQGVNASTNMKLTDTAFVYDAFTQSSSPTVAFAATYSRWLLYDKLTDIEHTIAGLRRFDGGEVPILHTQYCWLDFDRRWSLAHTQQRAERCWRQYSDNGAVYLESVLRNINMEAFMAGWGRSFSSAIRDPVLALPGGPEFFASVSLNGSLPAADEAAYWRSKGITRFQLQFTNARYTGLEEKVDIVNAFSFNTAMTTKRSAYASRWGSKTTDRMYWGLVNDLWGAVDNNTRLSGLSLVRNASTFFGNQNITMEQVFIEDGNIQFPFTPQDTMFREAVGPFNTIDAIWQSRPPALMQLYQLVNQLTRTAALSSVDAAAAFDSIGAAGKSLQLRSRIWEREKWAYMGGSVLCSAGATVNYVTGSFQFGGTCSGTLIEAYSANQMNMLFATVALGGPNMSSSLNMTEWCVEMTVDVEKCTYGLQQAAKFITAYWSEDARQLVQALVEDTQAAVGQLDVSFIQYAKRLTTDNQTEFQLLKHALLTPTSDLPVFDWIVLYDWAYGSREVVQFQGDNGSLTIISSSLDDFVITLSETDVPKSVSPYLRLATQYVTLMLVAVAALVLVYALLSRFRIAGSNLLGFNRVAGVVWIGRPLLVLRGIVAIGILSTSFPTLATHGPLVHMVEEPISPFVSIITAGEATWLLIVAIDLLLVVTEGRTHVYAPIVTNSVWFVTGIVQWLAPVHHRMTIDHQCELLVFQKQIACHSGTIYVGNSSRLLHIAYISIAGLVLVYFPVRRWATVRVGRDDGVYLPGIALGTYQQQYWLHDGQWFIDTASAALAGLLTVRVWSVARVLDIKTWTFLYIPKVAESSYKGIPASMKNAVRLGRLKLRHHDETTT